MSGWKRCLLMGVLAGTFACGSESDDGVGGDDQGSESDGGGSIMTSDATIRDGGVDAGRKDGGSVRVDGGTGTGGGNGDGGDAEDEMCGALTARIRDFDPTTQPDFEKFSGTRATTGLIESTLGADQKPVFKAAQGQVTSADSFAQWYHDTSTSIGIDIEIPLSLMAGSTSSYEYNNPAFFPIDGKGFTAGATPVEPLKRGEDGKDHNFSFTTEVHTKFTYRGGENFMFDGDDDLWIFVNGKLALDLGGLHSSLKGNIDFDAMATQLGISKGGTYSMDIFHAERHTTASHFVIRTNIDCFKPVIVI